MIKQQQQQQSFPFEQDAMFLPAAGMSMASILELPECHWQPPAWSTGSLANGMTNKQQPTKASLLGTGLPISYCQSLWWAAHYASGGYEISFHYTTNLQGMKL